MAVAFVRVERVERVERVAVRGLLDENHKASADIDAVVLLDDAVLPSGHSRV